MIEFKPDHIYHCPTKELSDRLLNLATEQGYVWLYSRDPLNTNSRWNTYGSDTCYNIIKGTFGSLPKYKEQYTHTIVTVAEDFLTFQLTDEMLDLINKWLNDSGFKKYLRLTSNEILPDVVKKKTYNDIERECLNNIRKSWISYIKSNW